jgi:hypothetical protein
VQAGARGANTFWRIAHFAGYFQVVGVLWLKLQDEFFWLFHCQPK